MNCNAMHLALLLTFSLFPLHAQAQDAPAEEAATTEAEPVTSATSSIAIFPFQSRSQIDTRVAAAMLTRLSKALEVTGKFNLLERSAMKDLGSAVTFSRKGYIKVDSAATWGAEHKVDYVITGMVVAAGKGHGGMGIGGVRISPKAISLAIDIRLIDCSTGKILIEDTFKQEKTGLGLAVGTVEFDPESKRGSEMVTVVLKKLRRAILTTLHPPVVTSVDESNQTLTLSYGNTVFEAGQRWLLFTPGQSVTDPKTGNQKMEKDTKTGAIRITVVQDSATTATIIDGTAAVGAIAKFDKPAKKKKRSSTK